MGRRLELGKNVAAGAAGAVMGSIISTAAMTGLSLMIMFIGWMLLKNFNSSTETGDSTPLFTDMTGMQYLGVLIMFIGSLPMLGWFLPALAQGLGIGVGLEVGEELAGGVMDTFMGE